MQKTTITIPKMDCPSEENLLRLKLDGVAGGHGLDFDIPGRRLIVFHDGQLRLTEDSIAELNLGGKRLSTEESDGPAYGEAAEGPVWAGAWNPIYCSG